MSTTRRQFLKRLGTGAVALVGVRFLSGCEHLEFESKVAGGLLPFITPAEDGSWYWQSGNGIAKDDAPAISNEDWALEISRENSSLATLSFADLQQYADEELSYWKTMRCVFGAMQGPTTTTLVANGIFTGIPLHVIFEDLGVTNRAGKLRTFGADGFESNIPLDRTLKPGPSPLPPLLAYELNGEPMSRLRGGPVRLVIPETWGYKNVKWLERLVVTDDNSIFGTYEAERFNPDTNPSVTPEVQRRIDDPGRIALGTVVTDPTSVAAEIEGPEVTVAGASFAGGHSVERVELSLDGGPFEAAEITGVQEWFDALAADQRALAEQAAQQQADYPWPNVWVTWKKTFTDLAPGDYTVTIRATDASGRVQSDDSSQPLVVAPEVRIPFRVT